MVAGFLSDRFGRRQVLFLCAILYGLSAVLSAVPRTFQEFLIARFIGGLGIGVSSMCCPIYIAELAPASRRGRLGSLFQTRHRGGNIPDALHQRLDPGAGRRSVECGCGLALDAGGGGRSGGVDCWACCSWRRKVRAG